jgi:hypothetical protein
MIDPENSVARLRGLAEKLSGHRDNLTPNVLATVLGEAYNSTEFYRRVVLLVDLAKLARKQVDELVGEAGFELYAKAIDGIVASPKNWRNFVR